MGSRRGGGDGKPRQIGIDRQVQLRRPALDPAQDQMLHGIGADRAQPERQALRLGTIGYDAVKHLALCRIERRPPKLDLTVYPYLPRIAVATTSAGAYMALLGRAA